MIESFDSKKNYKFVALIIIASYARNYLIKEELFANTWGGCESSLSCSIKPPGDLNKKTSSLLALGATVMLECSSQKGILIGKGGAMLKAIGTGARLQMQKVFDGPVYLELFVKVVPHWRQKPGRLAELGYQGE